MTYRLRKPLQVMPGQPSKPLFVEIMPGSIIAVEGDGRESGRVQVLYNGQIFMGFMQDITARAELVEGKTTLRQHRSIGS